MQKKLIYLLLFIQLTTNAQNFSLNFDGTDDVVELPKNAGVLGNNFTIEGWFKTTENVNPQSILIGFYNPTIIDGPIGIEVQNNGLLRFVYKPINGIFDEMYSTIAVNDDQWHHFAYVKEENRVLKMYIDGAINNIICINTSNITLPLFFDLGINRFATANNLRHFLGNIDDIKIWTIAKGGHEIFNEFMSEQSGTEQFLFSNYKFDIDSDTIFDCSLQKNHGRRLGTDGSNLTTQFSTDFPPLTDVDCGIGFTGTNGIEFKKVHPIKIYPNPSIEEITILLEDTAQAEAQIFSNDGKFIQKFKIDNGTRIVSTTQLPTGVYELRVVGTNGISTATFIKQ
jgi:hypothetical protein